MDEIIHACVYIIPGFVYNNNKRKPFFTFVTKVNLFTLVTFVNLTVRKLYI